MDHVRDHGRGGEEGGPPALRGTWAESRRIEAHDDDQDDDDDDDRSFV